MSNKKKYTIIKVSKIKKLRIISIDKERSKFFSEITGESLYYECIEVFRSIFWDLHRKHYVEQGSAFEIKVGLSSCSLLLVHAQSYKFLL